VIETARGRAELDASDERVVTNLFGAAARAAAGHVEWLAADVEAVRAWVMFASGETAPFAARVADGQERLAARFASAAPIAPIAPNRKPAPGIGVARAT